jgi:hypothetical protein
LPRPNYIDPLTDKVIFPLLDVFVKVNTPLPLVFVNVIGMPINIIANFSAYRFATDHYKVQHHYIRGSRFVLHEHPSQ